MLTHLTIKNYKCLTVVDIPLTPIHVLIGQNNTGKTSVLEILDCLGKACSTGSHSSTDVRYSFVKPTGPSYGNQVVIDDEFYLKADFIFKGDKTNFIIENFKGIYNSQERGQNVPYQLYSTFYYRPLPRIMKLPVSSVTTPDYSLQYDGFGLARLLDEILSFDVEKFLDLSRIFCDYFPQFDRILLQSSSGFDRPRINDDVAAFHTGVGKEICFSLRGANSRIIRATMVSDGIILILGILALLFSPRRPDLFLIEEPENGFHHSRLVEIINLFKKINQLPTNPQLLITTHSPYLLSEFTPDQVTLMRRNSDQTISAHPLRNATKLKERMNQDEFYLGELWTYLSEEELLK